MKEDSDFLGTVHFLSKKLLLLTQSNVFGRIGFVTSCYKIAMNKRRKKMEKQLANIQKIRVLPDRTLDLNSAERAKKLCRRYKTAEIIWIVILLHSVLPIIIGRILGKLSTHSGAFWLFSFCIILTFFSIRATKQQIYTGRCGLEQIDPNGSPFLGKFVTKKGHIRLINLLLMFCLLVVACVISIRYLSLYPSSNQTKGSFIQVLIGSIRSMGFLFSLIMWFSGIFAVLVYGIPYFWNRLKAFLRGSLPSFLLTNAAFLLGSAIVFYLLSCLSKSSANADAVVQSLGSRILGTAYDTGNPANMLFGRTDSVLASLSTASLYVSMCDTIVERLDEDPAPFREQWTNMLKDRSVRLTSLMMVLSIFYVGISNFTALSGVLGWVLRLIIFGVWAYSAFRSIAEIHIVRWAYYTAGVVLVDHLLLLPEVTNLWTGLLVIPALAIRAVSFLMVAVMTAFSIKLAQESSSLSPKPDDDIDLIHEKTLGEMFKEINDEAKREAPSGEMKN